MRKVTNKDIQSFEFSLAVKKPYPIRCKQMDEDFEIETYEGTLKGKKGDYLLIGVEGEMYPCKKKIFEKTYKIINEPPETNNGSKI